jgi:hypothetical protein
MDAVSIRMLILTATAMIAIRIITLEKEPVLF